MKKTKLFLVLFMLLGVNNVFALDSELDVPSQITVIDTTLGEETEPTYIYSSEETTISTVKGFTYNEKTNTLTIENSDNKYVLNATNMGSDFKLSVKGTNYLSSISLIGYGKDSNLNITGDGTLIVNKDKKYSQAIILMTMPNFSSMMLSEPETSKIEIKPTLTIDNTVTLKLYASQDSEDSSEYSRIIGIPFISEDHLNKSIVLKNGQDISKYLVNKEYINDNRKTIFGLDTFDNGAGKIYQKGEKFYLVDFIDADKNESGDESYVYYNPVLYNEKLKMYYYDYSDKDFDIDPYATLEDFEADGYQYVGEGNVYIPNYEEVYQKGDNFYVINGTYTMEDDSTRIGYELLHYDTNLGIYFYDYSLSEFDKEIYATIDDFIADGYKSIGEKEVRSGIYTYTVVKDSDGKEYAAMCYGYDCEEIEDVYNISTNYDTLENGDKYYYLSENKTIDKAKLEVVIEKEHTGFYSQYVDATSLVIEAKGETEAENTKGASKEVSKIIEAIENETDASKITGIDEETFDKVKEAIADGKIVTTELTTAELKASEVKKEVKEKVDATIKSNEKVLGYFDVNILLNAEGETLGNVTLLENEIKVVLDTKELIASLPEVKKGMIREYKVIRIHGDETKVLDATLNEDGTISFVTDKFSDYIVTYSDIENPATGDTVIVSAILLFASLIGLGLIAIKKF